MTKILELKQTGYTIKGLTHVTLWGGDDATIRMKPFNLKKLGLQAIKKNINDAGFGVQSINGAIIEVSEDYEGREIWIKDIFVNLNKMNDKQIDFLFESLDCEY